MLLLERRLRRRLGRLFPLQSRPTGKPTAARCGLARSRRSAAPKSCHDRDGRKMGRRARISRPSPGARWDREPPGQVGPGLRSAFEKSCCDLRVDAAHQAVRFRAGRRQLQTDRRSDPFGSLSPEPSRRSGRSKSQTLFRPVCGTRSIRVAIIAKGRTFGS
jgi:hypothetical protein